MEALTFVPTSSPVSSSSFSSDVAKQVRFSLWRQSSSSMKCAVNATQPLVYTAKANLRDTAVVKVSCCRNSNAHVLEARYIIGLAGPPGAGKSTVASEVVKRINKKWPQKAPSMDELVDSPEVAIVLPMDGFHLYRHQLDAMEDPKEAHARRGAPWTFDPTRLLQCLQTLKNEGSVCAPSFDHGVGDPVEDDIFVSLQHKVVLVEGNYLLLEEEVWKDISTLFDEKWFIDVDLDTSMERVLKRHMSKSKRSPDEAKWRIHYNDRPNAELIMKSKKNADLIVKSIDLRA
ncbi:hypothetical protein KSS87_011304 [Heliosperma pusillum]|nr:hypothetical protein KSS87_011304 [Heliosperma pusillum]